MVSASPNAVREQVRAAIAARAQWTVPQCDAWLFGHDPAFTAELAERGLIGITWPREFGGREGSALDRLTVTEELLRAGAPVAAHWIADRQIGPAILRYGSRQLQEQFLPRITAGEVTFCLGMSESESGSDLAAVRTRAVPVEDGYLITGQKLWTSNAHRSTHIYVLARVPGGDSKYDGLTEFVVDLSSPGIEVRPIHDLSGEHHFNETIFSEVFVPAENVIGEVGGGWGQVTEQLSFERGGIERVLSTYPILAVLQRSGLLHSEHAATVGALVARLHALRGLAVEVASAVDRGAAPVREAAMLKFLGTSFEAELVDFGRTVLAATPRPQRSDADRLVAQGILRSPGATLRGGTTEVLLDILARRQADTDKDGELARMVDASLSDLSRPDKWASLEQVWSRAVSLGWTSIGVSEEAGGSGGDMRDLATVVRALSRRGLSAPVAETALAAAVAERGGIDASCACALGLWTTLVIDRGTGVPTVSGRCDAVSWVPFASQVLAVAQDGNSTVVIRLDLSATGVRAEQYADLAGETSADLEITGSPLTAHEVVGGPDAVRRLIAGQLTLAAAAGVGAMEYATRLATAHADVRTQFGRPLRKFQAVAHHLARMEAEVTLAGAGLELAVAELLQDGAGYRAVAAKALVAQSSGAVARSAHQVLGAMGMTREHPLHRATVRLWSWRDGPVAATQLCRELGTAAIAAGADGLWDWLIHDTDKLAG